MKAVCLPPYPFVCEAYYKNGSMFYNTFTNEFRFIVQGETIQKSEGYWTCRHGTRRDTFSTGIRQNNTNNDLNIYLTEKNEKTTFAEQTWISSSTQDYEVDLTPTLANSFSKLYGLLIGAVLLVLCISVACNIWISLRCRKVQLKTDVADRSNQSNETAEHAMVLNEVVPDTQEDRTSEYESINENEMLPFQFCVAFGDNSSNLDDEAIATVHSSLRGNTSSSENSYLEVIDNDSYLNPYQPIENQHESEIVHNYSKIASLDYLDLCFPKLINLPLENFPDCGSDISIVHYKFYSLRRSEVNQIAAAACNGFRDNGKLSTSESISKSLEINQGYSEKATLCRNIDYEKTACSGKADILVSNDVCMFQYTAMTNLL
ncbi:unnamed protein product [Mytilus coruscus]|uniref:Uncharacterized protein n=1 Tax=Mytilus coruscus TaxID=42192 RepID=A0A6J8CPT5_MYTCO|nr:unnamed protein product [Mytilus coruscus]